MKEIDFIPEWYKAGRERKRRYVRQYTLLAIMFTLMLGWGFIINGHIASVNAEVQEVQTSFEKRQLLVQKTLDIEARIAEMRQKKALLDRIEARTPLTAIIGELSYLISKNVILTELSLENEPIEQAKAKANDSSTSAVVIRASDLKKDKQNEVISSSPSCCRVGMTGIAARPADAALLIAHLDQTGYFNHVSLVYSKPKKIKDRNVTEFCISCTVADYQLVSYEDMK